ncbi:MAG TPA: PilW family protein [Novimethylophilus sp.]|jgi:type IV pilus assembly protein PilW|uniref:PilW family protein n=1 Tax=Novimethylophilus sp. TaxID=2137426 RepID=UPI002F3F769D
MIFRPSQSITAGFSLVEIMVGMVIGLIGIMVIMHVTVVSQGRQRTTTGSDDAQNNGAIALYGMQRDIRQGGYGISETNLVGCNVLLRAGITLNSMAPVTINHASIPAGDANTDTVLVVYGNASISSQGNGIRSQPATATYAVQSFSLFNTNDLVIATPQARSTPCNLVMDTVTGSVNPNVSVTTGVANMAGGTLYNLGSAPKIVAYAVRNGNLTACDYILNDCSIAANTTNASIWVPIADNIVSMRAQYGRDTTNPMDGIADIYDQTTPTTACNWVKTPAVRIALVARSAQRDPATVTAAAPTWAGTSANPIVLTGLTNWQNYRYRVFQTVVPLRNVTWLGVQAGC